MRADVGIAKPFEHRGGFCAEIKPCGHRRQQLHQGDPAHPGWVASRAVHTESRTPGMTDHDDVAQTERGDERLEVARVIFDPVADVGLVGVPEADQIRSDATDLRSDVRGDVAPQIRRRGIAVQEQSRRSTGQRWSLVQVSHPCSENIDVAQLSFGHRPLLRLGETLHNNAPANPLGELGRPTPSASDRLGR
jgi:hypothetical protein